MTIRQLSESEKLDLLRLARCENVGPISFFHLLARFGNAKEALNRLPGISTRAKIPSMDSIKREWGLHQERGIFLISFFDARYPPSLRSLRDAPPFISARGNLSLLHRTCFGIVGSRNASQAGVAFCEIITKTLCQQKWIIVSGLARGIDACAHKSALDTGTIAVVAGGIDHIYPPEHKRLHQDITEKGLVISEDPLEQEPHGTLFLKRNRLIPGLCWGVLVVEATLKSGSLVTAKYALEQNRSVFAVPGHPLDTRSRGVNRMIKDGACLVENAQDILNDYALIQTKPSVAREDHEAYDAYDAESSFFNSFTENTFFSDNCEGEIEKIKNALGYVPTSVHDLAHKVDLPVNIVRGLLVEMELAGLIERYPGDEVMLSLPTTES
jgi:DNA processing protein